MPVLMVGDEVWWRGTQSRDIVEAFTLRRDDTLDKVRLRDHGWTEAYSVEKVGPCNKCREREGTEVWGGEEPTFAFTHGFTQRWCKLCVLRAQVQYAEKVAADLPRLRAELAKLESVTIEAGTRWIKKHGNIRTVLEVEDASDQNRIRTRIIDDGGSRSYETGQTRYHDFFTLTFYYEPHNSADFC